MQEGCEKLVQGAQFRSASTLQFWGYARCQPQRCQRVFCNW